MHSGAIEHINTTYMQMPCVRELTLCMHVQTEVVYILLQKNNTSSLAKLANLILDWLKSLKQFFINVPYHILVASLTLMALKQSHQSKTSYKYMICHIDEKMF